MSFNESLRTDNGHIFRRLYDVMRTDPLNDPGKCARVKNTDIAIAAIAMALIFLGGAALLMWGACTNSFAFGHSAIAFGAVPSLLIGTVGVFLLVLHMKNKKAEGTKLLTDVTKLLTLEENAKIACSKIKENGNFQPRPNN